MEASNISTPVMERVSLTYKLEVTRWSLVTLYCVIFVLGVPSNLLILGVCRAKGVRTTTHIFIAALALADLSTCILKLGDAIILASASHYLKYDSQYPVNFLSTGLLYATALLTTCVAFDRFDAVCRSLRRAVTRKRAVLAAGVCYLSGFIGVLPEVGHKIHSGLLGGSEERQFVTRSAVKFIPVTLYFLSLLTVVVLYFAIFFFVRKRSEILVTDGSIRRQIADTTISQVSGRVTPPSNNNVHRGLSTGHVGPIVSIIAASLGGVPTVENAPPGQLDITHTTPYSRSDNQEVPASVQNIAISGSRGSFIGVPTVAARPRLGQPRHQPRRVTPQSRMTKMLSIATFIFFILWLPNVCLRIYALGSLFADFNKSPRHANIIAALVALKDVVYINCVVNAVIYGLANRRFRQECWDVVRTVRRQFNANATGGGLRVFRTRRVEPT